GLTVNGMALQRASLALGESFGMSAKRTKKLARHPDESEVAQPRRRAQEVLVLRPDPRALRHFLGDRRHGLGLAAEKGIVGRENPATQIERALVGRPQFAIGRIQGLLAALEGLHLR